MLTAGSEPTISAGERPQTYALDRAATGTGRGHKYGVSCDTASLAERERLTALSNPLGSSLANEQKTALSNAYHLYKTFLFQDEGDSRD